MTASAASELHTLPISARPRPPWSQTWRGVAAMAAFFFACAMINGSQIVLLLPFWLVPLAATRRVYHRGVRYSKGAFGSLLVLMSQWFAPTEFVLTCETAGPGKFTQEEIAELVERDAAGRAVALRLPQKAVVIGNHQVYSDWWYAWSLLYLAGMHRDVYIVLKKSLKWVPILGWGMQFYDFIFLARSWASDRLQLSQSLSRLARRAEAEDTPFTLLLYPEGTLVSKDTRPVSKKFADKEGIPDMLHTLLPRSTGLHYSLRSLAPRLPDLQLIDITMAYPGIPPLAYGQSYYTLRSIWYDRVPPPTIHIHVRKFDVSREVPIGNVAPSDPAVIPGTQKPGEHAVEVEIPAAERDAFELWLRGLWRQKDALIQKYLDTGSFGPAGADASGGGEVAVPIELRHRYEILDAFCFFVPAVVGWAWAKLR